MSAPQPDFPPFVPFESFTGKLFDKTPLLRRDIQYDLLNELFSNSEEVFTDPNPTLSGKPAGSKVCFRDLYVNSLIHAPKASRVLRDRMKDMPLFGTDFGMISLLANIGRVGNSMAFFTEMKTTLRFYHPIPSLTSNGNIQDVPRIRLILKSITLPSENNGCPSTPTEVLAEAKVKRPSTTAANFFFVLANHADSISDTHVAGQYSFLSLFMPIAYSSASRARALLWLLHNYLEGPPSEEDIQTGTVVNPFCDPEYSRHAPPPLKPLTPDEFAQENVDTEHELTLKDELIRQREVFVAIQTEKDPLAPVPPKRTSLEEPAMPDRPKRIRKRPSGPAGPLPPPTQPKPGGTLVDLPIWVEPTIKPDPFPDRLSPHDQRARFDPSLGHPSGRYPKDDSNYSDHSPIEGEFVDPANRPNIPHARPPAGHYDDSFNERPHFPPHRRNGHTDARIYGNLNEPHPPPWSVSPKNHTLAYKPEQNAHPNHGSPGGIPHPPHRVRRPYDYAPALAIAQFPSRRTMIQHAWHVVTTQDPLQDSDEERDDYVREDYIRRIAVVSRLRGRTPTPEPEQPFRPSLVTVDSH